MQYLPHCNNILFLLLFIWCTSAAIPIPTISGFCTDNCVAECKCTEFFRECDTTENIDGVCVFTSIMIIHKYNISKLLVQGIIVITVIAVAVAILAVFMVTCCCCCCCGHCSSIFCCCFHQKRETELKISIEPNPKNLQQYENI